MANSRQMTKRRLERAKSSRLRHTVVFLACALVLCAGAYLLKSRGQRQGETPSHRQVQTDVGAVRPKKWAQRLELSGVPNFHKVSDNLYRGAQPTAEGMRRLKSLGVKTIVNLRSFHSDRDEIGDTGLVYEHVHMRTWHVQEKKVVRFLQIVTDKDRMPVFVHCHRGADRTGTMCAIYRVVVQGWSKSEAIDEMTKGGFGFNSLWRNLIEYIRKLDVDQIRQRANISKRSPIKNQKAKREKYLAQRAYKPKYRRQKSELPRTKRCMLYAYNPVISEMSGNDQGWPEAKCPVAYVVA
jgi:protein tyrosine/serine phosphatase